MPRSPAQHPGEALSVRPLWEGQVPVPVFREWLERVAPAQPLRRLLREGREGGCPPGVRGGRYLFRWPAG